MCAMGLNLGLGLTKNSPSTITIENLETVNELGEKIESFLQTLSDGSELAEEALGKFNAAIAEHNLDISNIFEKMEQLLNVINQGLS